ncbi:hypothetical protein BH23VER1_BH23VER1_24700 [soil metagenome]
MQRLDIHHSEANGTRPGQSPLDEADARAMVRLLGEVAGMAEADHADRKRALMDGLCRLIGADFWLWGLASRFKPGQQPDYAMMLHGGFGTDQLSKFLVAVDHPDLAALTSPIAAEVARDQNHITRLRQDMDPAGRFSASAACQLWQAADVGPLVLSFYPVHQSSISVTAIYRRFDSPPFDRRECKIAHIVLSEVPWVHEEGWPAQPVRRVPSLAPRHRLALNLLLEGLGRKQVADHMGISIHTANDYVKAVYAHFQVNSQAGLVARFRIGDGHDTP